MRTVEGHLDASGARWGLVASRWNGFITERLVEGAEDALVRHGADRDAITLVRVPGSFELPLAADRLARSGEVDAVVALSCVIRGATSHFDHVAGEVSGGAGRVALDVQLPVTFGVITAETLEQALERAGSKAGNKGAEAAVAAIEMVDLLRKLGG